MKRVIPVAILIALFSSTPVLAGDTGGMKMDGHAGMAMDSMQHHKATGAVKAIDVAKGTITIAHGAVASANWPAMKMSYKIAPEMVGEIKVEQHVEFEFVAKGMDATITKITVLK